MGDVRSLALLRAFQTAVQLFKAPGDASLQELRQHIARALRDEEELAINPTFFSEVVTHWHKVGRVDIAIKPEHIATS